MTDQWLTRTAQNVISGPFSTDHVRNLILEGRLGLQDEVCSAGGYWFYLHETSEVTKQLGVQVPRAAAVAGDENTQTQTQTQGEGDETTDPELPQTHVPAPATPAAWAAQGRASSAVQTIAAPSQAPQGEEAPAAQAQAQDDHEITEVRPLGSFTGRGQVAPSQQRPSDAEPPYAREQAPQSAPSAAPAEAFMDPSRRASSEPFSGASDRQYETRLFVRIGISIAVALVVLIAFALSRRG